MKVLISNDDGIFAPGIAALAAAFRGAGYEVVVCAPDRQRSAASHSLTIGRPISVKETGLPGAAKAYAIGGTPADCVKLGLTVLCPDAEAVISGVNYGSNLGTDVLYSGTVAAAMEGAICGRPAMAVSQMEQRVGFEASAALAVQLFERMLAHPLPPLCMLNLNCPVSGEIRGVVTAGTGKMIYREGYAREEQDGAVSYVLRGAVDDAQKPSEDYARIREGYATVTVLHADLEDVSCTAAWNGLI